MPPPLPPPSALLLMCWTMCLGWGHAADLWCDPRRTVAAEVRKQIAGQYGSPQLLKNINVGTAGSNTVRHAPPAPKSLKGNSVCLCVCVGGILQGNTVYLSSMLPGPRCPPRYASLLGGTEIASDLRRRDTEAPATTGGVLHTITPINRDKLHDYISNR